jgi:hypothetical protein
MKKIMLLSWLAIVCLLLTNTAASGQSSDKSLKGLLEQIMSK